MPATVKEIVVQPHWAAAQYLFPDLAQTAFQRISWCLDRVATRRGILRVLQERARIELAIGCQRESCQRDEGCRHHVVWQSFTQTCTHRCDVYRLPLTRHQAGDHAQLALWINGGQHHRFAHAGHRSERRLHLTEFDAETTQLDLPVRASEKLDIAVGQPACDVTSAIHARAGRERISQEALGVQLRPSPVATRHAVAADQE